MGDDDCISITEKTFDLSLDDTQIDDSDEDVYSMRSLHHSQQQPPDHQSILHIDPSQAHHHHQKENQNQKFNTSHQMNHGRENQNVQVKNFKTPLAPIITTSTPTKSTNSRSDMYKSIEILQRISGTDLKIYDSDQNLSKLILELSENSELKLQFYERNYKFLENLYETLQKDYEVVKKDYQKSKLELKELKVKGKEYDLIKSAIEKRKSGVNLDSVVNALEDNSKDKNKVIAKQEKEIREYKRFIKEMMER